MPTYFAARVELHGVQHDHTEYTRLHSAMQSQGFSRVIVGRDGRRWQLPPAEYVHGGAGQTIEGILAKIQAAVTTIGWATRYTSVVHRCDDWGANSLKPA
jgi:hypothetical protein